MAAAISAIGVEEDANGKEANFLLLDADPLADIANTRKIATVVFRGVVLDPAQLETAARPGS